MGIFIGGPMDGAQVSHGQAQLSYWEVATDITLKDYKRVRYERTVIKSGPGQKFDSTREVFFVLPGTPAGEAEARATEYFYDKSGAQVPPKLL